MNNSIETTFGKSLRIERQNRQLTQAQLAEMLDTTQQNIAGMEAGRSLPKQPMFAQLCEIFGRHSAVAQLPPRGMIKLAYDAVEDAMGTSRPAIVRNPPVDDISPQAHGLGELFDMLPDDPILRATVFHKASSVILDVINGRSTPISTPVRTGLTEKSHG